MSLSIIILSITNLHCNKILQTTILVQFFYYQSHISTQTYKKVPIYNNLKHIRDT